MSVINLQVQQLTPVTRAMQDPSPMGPQRNDPEQTDEGFRVGDVVTRCGDDRQRVVRVRCGDLMEVVCIQGSDIYAVGDEETNLSRRYSYPDELTIDGDTVKDRKVLTYCDRQGHPIRPLTNAQVQAEYKASGANAYCELFDNMGEATLDACVTKYHRMEVRVTTEVYPDSRPTTFSVPNPAGNRAARRRSAAIARKLS